MTSVVQTPSTKHGLQRPVSVVKVGTNSKLGPGMGSVSMPVGTTCPGATEACALKCYAKKGRVALQRPGHEAILAKWRADPAAWEQQVIAESTLLRVVRIHVSGDFHQPTYVDAWRRIADACPSTVFYAYTRSWRVPGLRASLERLRRRANVRLFASVDDSTREPPPKGWRVAWTGSFGQGLVCRNLTEGITCAECQYCWLATAGDVHFPWH